MTISTRILTVLVVMGGMALAGLTSGFTTAKDPDPTYFFEHEPNTDVSNPSNWTLSPDNTGCSGFGKSCKIELTADYVDASVSPAIIDTTVLPQLPTITVQSSQLEVPNGSTGIYEQIFNQNP